MAGVLGVAGEEGGTGEDRRTGVDGGTGLPGQTHKGPGSLGPGVPRLRRGTEEAIFRGVLQVSSIILHKLTCMEKVNLVVLSIIENEFSS